MTSAFAYREADLERLKAILEQTAVATKPSSPGFQAYLAAWIEAIAGWIAGLFSDRAGLADGVVRTILILALLVVALAVAFLVLSITRRLRERRSREARAHPGWTEAADVGALRDRAAWKLEIQTRLSRGDVAGALEALWWWFAASLSLETAIESSWTTRELLVKARRRELLGLGSALDLLMYGRRSPSPEEVTAYLARLEARLG